MDNHTFTTLIEEKLLLLEMPEILQEIVVTDLAEIILKQVYGELVATLSPENAERALTLLDAHNYKEAYDLLMGIEGVEERVLHIAETTLEDFSRQMREES